jgi:hypothetical protein
MCASGNTLVTSAACKTGQQSPFLPLRVGVVRSPALQARTGRSDPARLQRAHNTLVLSLGINPTSRAGLVTHIGASGFSLAHCTRVRVSIGLPLRNLSARPIVCAVAEAACLVDAPQPKEGGLAATSDMLSACSPHAGGSSSHPAGQLISAANPSSSASWSCRAEY